jgi:hypothetical protein
VLRAKLGDFISEQEQVRQSPFTDRADFLSGAVEDLRPLRAAARLRAAFGQHAFDQRLELLLAELTRWLQAEQ